MAILNTATEDDFKKLGLFVEDLKEELNLQDTTVYKGTIDPRNFGDVKLFPFVVNAKISSFASSEVSENVKTNILANKRVEEAAGKLVSLRDSDVPDEYIYIIEDKANDLIDVSDDLEEIESNEGEKGFGYKIRLFLGFAHKSEQEEITQLEESKEKLANSILVLTKLIAEVPNDVAKALLKEQVEALEEEKNGIDSLIQKKEKKSKGLIRLFGLIGK